MSQQVGVPSGTAPRTAAEHLELKIECLRRKTFPHAGQELGHAFLGDTVGFPRGDTGDQGAQRMAGVGVDAERGVVRLQLAEVGLDLDRRCRKA